MYRKATLDDCNKVYNLICEMECRQLAFDRFSVIYQEQMSNGHYYCLLCEHDRKHDELVQIAGKGIRRWIP